VLLDLAPATFRHHHGYTTPCRWGLTSSACAGPEPPPWRRRSVLRTCLPLPPRQVTGAVDGGAVRVNTTERRPLGPVADNHNAVVLARSGAGKSYLSSSTSYETSTRACTSR
jgi:hypothetical protein